MTGKHDGTDGTAGKPSTGLIIAVVLVVSLAVAGVVAMIAPSGDQGQSKDPGTQVEVPPTSPEIQAVPVIGSSVDAQVALSSGAETQGASLVCTFELSGIPDDRSTVVHTLVSGKGTGPVPLLHPGEEAVDGVVKPSDGPADTFVVSQAIDGGVSGAYTCEVVAVVTSTGSARLEGQTKAKVSA